MFFIERPMALFAILGIIPVILYSCISYRRLVLSVVGLYSRDNTGNSKLYRRLKYSVAGRTVMRCTGWIMIVFAYAGISWGTKNVPVQKSGCAVSLVYDISYSMTTKDVAGKVSRLEAVKQYSRNLISFLDGTSISVVLAKGDGILAVPLTEDMMAVNSIINVLSPDLMTSAGTSLGKGITAAIRAFPSNCPQSAHIILFTDGDETDDSLSSALEDAIKYGIDVTIVGFGSKNEIQIITADGKTPAMTALREEELMQKIEEVNKRINSSKVHSPQHVVQCRYIAASTVGSASMILKLLNHKKEDFAQDGLYFSYETQYIKRHSFFIFLAIIFFIFSFIAGELDLSGIRVRFLKKTVTSIAFTTVFALMTVSCSGSSKDRNSILKGSWYWYQGKYQYAVANFMQTYYDSLSEQDSEVNQYAVFDLASTYIRQHEYESAMNRLNEISGNPLPELESPVFYNMGVIANHEGDYASAIKYFKKAVLADMNNVDAKINLELSIQNLVTKNADQGVSVLTGITEEKKEDALKSGVFNLIKENEQNQWKKLQSEQQESTVLDY